MTERYISSFVPAPVDAASVPAHVKIVEVEVVEPKAAPARTHVLTSQTWGRSSAPLAPRKTMPSGPGAAQAVGEVYLDLGQQLAR